MEFSRTENDRMKVDVRARILWGEDVGDIRKDWTARGAPDAALRGALDAAGRERDAHFRGRGWRDLFASVLFLVAGGVAAHWYWDAIRNHIRVDTKFMSGVLACAVLAPGVGAILLTRGIRRIRTGGAHELGATDVGSSDSFD